MNNNLKCKISFIYIIPPSGLSFQRYRLRPEGDYEANSKTKYTGSLAHNKWWVKTLTTGRNIIRRKQCWQLMLPV